MKNISMALLAVACAGASHAAPTTFYFAGTTTGYQSIDAASSTWTNTEAPHAFSGSLTVDGRNGLLTSILGFPAEVQGSERLTNSRCGVVTGGACSDEPPAPTNILAFSVLFEGGLHTKWTLPLAGATEGSIVSKLQSSTASTYGASGSLSIQNVVGTLPLGERTRFATVGIGVQLQGASGAIGDLWDLAQFPDLAQIDRSASTVNFSSVAYTCTIVDGGCQDTVFDLDGFSFQGRLSYVGMAPQAVAEVPEPASAALVLAGVAGLIGLRLRARRGGRGTAHTHCAQAGGRG